MSTSNNIGFALAVGFVVYITVRGELPAYLCVVGIGANCPAVGATTTATQTATAPTTVNNYYGGSSSTITTPPSTGGNSGGTISTPPGSATGYNPPGTSGSGTAPPIGIVTSKCFDASGNQYDCTTGAPISSGGYSGGAGASQYCYDSYGNIIDCSSQAYGGDTNGYGCTDENGNVIECGTPGAIGGY